MSKGVARIHLNGLHPDDALALIQHAGVNVCDKRQFEQFIETFGRHSLLVTLVAGKINCFRRYAAEGRHLTVSHFDLKQSQSNILQYTLQYLKPEAMRFLSQIAAFGDAVKYDVLTVFNPYVQQAPMPVEEVDNSVSQWMLDRAKTDEDRQYWKAQIDQANAAYQAHLKAQADYDRYLKSNEYRKALTQFDAMLSELEKRGLLRWEKETDLYDMHPVVRGTAFDRLEGDARVSTFERIRGHVERQTDDIENAKEVQDLANTIGVYRALIGAGKWDEAAEFFINRLRDKLQHNIAAYYTVIELLTPLFADGTDTLPRLNDAFLQSSITTILAGMFYYIGRKDEALTIRGLTLKLILDRDDSANLVVSLQNYALSLDSDSQLALAEATKNESEIILSTLFLLG
jgi:tetratricopeptide (TPR) repeat protein